MTRLMLVAALFLSACSCKHKPAPPPEPTPVSTPSVVPTGSVTPLEARFLMDQHFEPRR